MLPLVNRILHESASEALEAGRESGEAAFRTKLGDAKNLQAAASSNGKARNSSFQKQARVIELCALFQFCRCRTGRVPL